MAYKIAVTDYEFADLVPEEHVMAKAGLSLTPYQCRTEQDLIEACHDADAIINQYAQITDTVLRELKKCRVISRYGIGLNTIDVPVATSLGICIGNVPDGSLEEVSDHTIGLLLAASRGIAKFDRAVKSGRWDYTVVKPLYRIKGKTLGLLSFGRISQRVAVKMKSFGVRTITYDPFADRELAKAMEVELVDLETLCCQSDYLSVHAPLTDETWHLIDADHLALMKSTAIVINTGRGPVVDETALLKALTDGTIAGAGLDVFESEPLKPGHPLLSLENVVLSPHAAWYSEDSEVEIRAKTAQNVVEVMQGRYPTYLANPEVRSPALNLED